MSKKRKTRQEKIIADLRRKLQATKETKWEAENEKLETKTSHFPSRTANIASGDARQNPASFVPLPTSQSSLYLKKDLTKTFVLAILAFSLELVLYFWLG